MSKIGSKAGIQGESGFETMQAIDRLDKTLSKVEDLQTRDRARTAAYGQDIITHSPEFGMTEDVWVEVLSVRISKADPNTSVLIVGVADVNPGSLDATGSPVTGWSPESSEFMLRYLRNGEQVFEVARSRFQSDIGGSTAYPFPHSVIDVNAGAGIQIYTMELQWSDSSGGAPVANPSLHSARFQVVEIL